MSGAASPALLEGGSLLRKFSAKRRGSTYSRNFGVRPDGTQTRNWSNEEFGIFPGSGQTSQLKQLSKKNAREYTSVSQLLHDRKANHLTRYPLPMRYTKPVTSAQEVGWDLHLAEWHDNQHFPCIRGPNTAFDSDIIKGHVKEQMVLRRVGMKC